MKSTANSNDRSMKSESLDVMNSARVGRIRVGDMHSKSTHAIQMFGEPHFKTSVTEMERLY